jgi:hypothetical protein
MRSKILGSAVLLTVILVALSSCNATSLVENTPSDSPINTSASLTPGVDSEPATDASVGENLPIPTGIWSEDGKTFTNEWSNIKATLPDGWYDNTQEALSFLPPDHDTSQSAVDFSFAVSGDVYTGASMNYSRYEAEDAKTLCGDLTRAYLALDSDASVSEPIEVIIGGERYWEAEINFNILKYDESMYVSEIEDGIFAVLNVRYTDETRQAADAFAKSIAAAE